jgi:hypothetical protein
MKKLKSAQWIFNLFIVVIFGLIILPIILPPTGSTVLAFIIVEMIDIGAMIYCTKQSTKNIRQWFDDKEKRRNA